MSTHEALLPILAMSGAWKRLRLTGDEKLPRLLVRYVSTAKGYDIYATDLVYVWSERLGFKEILQRAEEEETTIDPNEDPEQFDVLLQKIGEALDGRSGSSVRLGKGLEGADALTAHISVRLPAPLQPLQWTTHLSRQPPESTVNHLLLPLLREESDRESQQQFLLDQIKHKDWALGKLLGKIDSMGVDLATVFPNIAGLRAVRKDGDGNTLAHAAKFIKGAAPFDEKKWLDEAGARSSEAELATTLRAELYNSAKGIETSVSVPDRWWESLTTESLAPPALPAVQSPTIQHQQKRFDQAEEETASESENETGEFERQEMPPESKQREGIEEDAPKPQRKIGVIGGKKPVQSVSAKPSPQEEMDKETESESDQGQAKKVPTGTSPAAAPKARVLGAIGGKTRTRTIKKPSPLDTPETAPEHTAVPAQAERKAEKSTGKKLGVIGGKKQAPSDFTAQDHHQPVTSKQETAVQEPAVPEETEETEEARAERRREELKRRLEAKSKAPTKKKRRF
ncbi:hypothetical protein ASPZODRAFT_163158 [Penicilliopsis zonata CBS 506.65]|uniref:Non-homologous end-joining factor 1 n=1 Tax=Penicilliopsis zonata CBS 506.65 TaxID=1073090 RepID=A0A1L9SVZ2_9EURO|nr:hypothetical protein ASPZODRAFT_163158 [Penicilliopsis zonata CBS 506.65]OJJ51304.1 hypothetical protein ASPZODRAFT_163158 [Penicilliopsis zonata CBS 506.65]